MNAQQANEHVKLHVQRTRETPNATLGTMTIDGRTDTWYILEPGGPDSTVAGSDKRINAGTYTLKPYSSAKYKDVYELQQVPGRTKILLHSGNYHNHTLGCLMPGKGHGTKDGDVAVWRSKEAMNEIKPLLKQARTITVTITNSSE